MRRYFRCSVCGQWWYRLYGLLGPLYPVGQDCNHGVADHTCPDKPLVVFGIRR